MATKFYFQNRIRSNISPNFSNVWSGTSQGTRWLMLPEKGDGSISDGSTISLSASANTKELDRQYVSPPLNGTQIISGQCSGRLLVQEFVSNDNVNQIIIGLRLVSNDGTFFRATGLNVAHYGNTAEFNTSYQNKNFASGTNLTRITGQDGDRIVLEIGYCTSVGGTTPQASAKWGDGLSDIGIDEVGRVDAAGWFSLGNVDLKFKRNSSSVIIS